MSQPQPIASSVQLRKEQGRAGARRKITGPKSQPIPQPQPMPTSLPTVPTIPGPQVRYHLHPYHPWEEDDIQA